MSYCVNCGVELAQSEKRCPLCNTIVLNPNSFQKQDTVFECKEYERIRIPFHMDIQAMATVVSILLLIPIFVSIVCNIIESGTLSWSLYVVGAVIVAFVVVLLPAVSRKAKPYLFIAIDGVVMFLYLGMINLLTSKGAWSLHLGLPICFMTTIFSMLYTVAFRNKKIGGLLKSTVFIVFTGLYTLGLEIIINDFTGSSFHLSWSHYVLIPCLVISLALLFINSRKKLKEDLKKKLFI